MDGESLVSADGAALIDGLTNDVDDSAERLGADGDSDGVASIHDRLSTHETLSGVESNRSHVVSTQVLGDLENETVTSALHLESIENGGKFTLELHVDDSTDNLGNLSSGAAKESYTRRHPQSISLASKHGKEQQSESEPKVGLELTLGGELGQHCNEIL